MKTPKATGSAFTDRFTVVVAGGRVAGTDHRRAGRDCQDAFAWLHDGAAVVAAVCDGCGSGAWSEAGAMVGARLWTAALARQLGGAASMDLSAQEVWERAILPAARVEVANALAALARAMGGDFERVVAEHFLFTIVGAAVTEHVTAVFSLGDGVVAVNGRIQVLGPFAGNQPPYLGYDLLPGVADSHAMQVHALLPSAEVEAMILATDGAVALVPGHADSRVDRHVPGGDQTAGDLWQFADARYLRNRDAIRRRLAVLNRDAGAIDWQRGKVERRPGLLADDTAIISIGRRVEAHRQEHAQVSTEVDR